MEKRNTVFIAKSLDGFIADRNGGLEWLEAVPNPEHKDMGYGQLMANTDAILMGRVTFETVCNFDCDWPYTKPVFVLSKTLSEVPKAYIGKVELVNGELKDIIESLNQKGFNRLYIDGGSTIQSFLKEDLIDELILTTFPILLGGGAPLFSSLPKELEFEHVSSKLHLNQLVQDHYKRKR